MYYDCLDDFADVDGPADRSRTAWLAWAIGGFCVLLSVAVFLVNTRHGIGIFVDSTRYMGISERPYDAPLYAWMVQAAMARLETNDAAKLLGLIFLVANTTLIWHLLMRSTNRYPYALVGTLVIILAPQFVALHSIAMSEPPFLLFILLTLLAFLKYLEAESRAWLIACAVALALATLTRFTAPPLGAALAICLLLNPRFPLARRIADAAILAVVSASIFLSWIAYSHLTAGRSIGRELWLYGNMGAKEWLTSLEALTAWLLPDVIPFAVRVIVFVAFAVSVGILTVVHARWALILARRTRVVDAQLPAALGLFFFFYMGFMVLSTSLEANLSLNSRYAFPAYVTTVLMTTIVLANLANAKGIIRVLRHGIIALALVILASHTIRTVVRSEEAYRTGIGYAGVEWTTSPTMAAISKLPANATLYSNGADAIAYVLERPAFFIPERVQLRTGQANPEKPLELQLQRLREKMKLAPSFVVIFDKVDWRFYLLNEAELVQQLSLEKIADEPDGRIYAVPEDTDIK